MGGGGKGADPGSARLLLDPEALSASAGSLAALRNLAVPLNASGFAALRRLGDRFGALRTLGIIIDTQARMCAALHRNCFHSEGRIRMLARMVPQPHPVSRVLSTSHLCRTSFRPWRCPYT